MKLSIVILNYKTAGLVRQCVRGIKAAQLQLDYELMVIDNASDDNIGQWLKKYQPSVRFIALAKNYGYSAGNNVGLKAARAEYILILNPDVVISVGRLEKLVEFMDHNPAVGLAGPRLTNPDGSLQYSAYNFPTIFLPLLRRTVLGRLPYFNKLARDYQMMAWDHATNQPVAWLLGACLIARRAALSEVGYLDERYFLYVEDTDWCRRFWAKGWQVYYAAAVELVHFHERLSAQAGFTALGKKITWIHINSWIKYFVKWGLHPPPYPTNKL